MSAGAAMQSVSGIRAVGPQRGGRRAPSSSRRLAGTVAVLAAVLLSAGCATKRDVTLLRDEIRAMQAHQDSLYGALRAQNRVVLDSVRHQSELMVRIRGELGNYLLNLEQQLITVQELTGQGQQQLMALRRELDQRSQTFQSDPAGDAPPDDGGTADELYAIGMEQLRREATGTARHAFQQLLDRFPEDGRAPDAQYHFAETYVVDRSWDRAFEEFERVVERYPESARAPAALYRAAVLAEELEDVRRARQYLERVRAGYPGSDEAQLAGEMLTRLPRP